MSTRARATSMRAIRHGQQRTQLARILQWLYGAGEQGIAVPDLTPGNGFLFQDSAGTTPVTAYEQPVGLILDRSKGGNNAFGTTIVTNGTFDTNLNGWTLGGGSFVPTWTANGIKLLTDGSVFSDADQQLTTVAGQQYQLTFTLTYPGIGSVQVLVGTSQGGSTLLNTNITGGGSQGYTFIASGTTTWIRLRTGSSNATGYVLDDIAVRAFPAGNHIIQATSTKRPTLSARYNLLTYTQQFDNAAWLKTNLNTTGTPAYVNVAVAPDGTTTADKLIANTTSGLHLYRQNIATLAGSYTMSVYAKAAEYTGLWLSMDGGSNYGLFTLTGAGTATATIGTATITAVGNGWYLCTHTATRVAGTAALFFAAANPPGTLSFAGNDSDGILLWGADLRPTIDTIGQPAYQRVGASNDYDTAGFYPYLAFDGTDDSMATAATVDFSGTDKMTVFAGVTKLSDAATGVVFDYGNFLNAANAACFGLAAPQQASPLRYYMFGAATTGTTAIQTIDTNASKAAPVTSVATGVTNASVPQTVLRVNGQQIDSSSANIGTSNFGAATLNIGQRPNSTSLFNGRMYPFFIRGAATDAGLIAQVEQYIRARMPVNF